MERSKGCYLDERRAWKKSQPTSSLGISKKKIKFSLRRPRRKHIKSDPDEQELFKNHTLANKVAEIAKKHPNDVVEVWAEDEHRVGLQPIIRGVWVPTGSTTVTIPVNPNYEWYYLYAFVHPKSGRNYWWLLPSCNMTMFEMALEDMAKTFEMMANSLS